MWPLQRNSLTNSYVSLILSNKHTYKEHSWHDFFNFKFDIFHMHWPETYLNLPNVFHRYLCTFFVIFYLIILKVLRKKIIWTVHNLKPHENRSPKLAYISYLLFYFFSNRLIFLSNISKNSFYEKYRIKNINAKISIINHPLYSIPQVKQDPKLRKSCLFFGLMRSYKNIDNLIGKYSLISSHYPLYLLGRCEKSYQKKLIKQAGSNVIFEFGPYEETRLQQYLNETIGVIIPYSDVTNSGVVFRAISSNVNLLLPDLPYMRELSKTFNYERKCLFYSGVLDFKIINDFIEQSESNVNNNYICYKNHNILIQNQHSQIYNSFQRV